MRQVVVDIALPTPRKEVRSRERRNAIGWPLPAADPPNATAAPGNRSHTEWRGPAVFARETYAQRRRDLISRLDGGIVLLPGNRESPINYTDNC